MIKIIISVLLLISVKAVVLAQENTEYIEGQISELETLVDKGDFVKGLIYLDNDTIETDLLTFKGRRKINYFLFCLAKTENDSIQIFRSDRIRGYKIADITFISHNSGKSSFFLQQIKSGKIDLFEKCSLPDDTRLLYYLKFPYSDNFYVINPLEKNVTEHQMPDTGREAPPGAVITYLQSKGIHEQFKKFISTHLGDCIKVTNMVKSEFYTINDIPRIVESYNNCL